MARILIRTVSTKCLNQSITVCINKVNFSMKIVQDWCGPLQWSPTVSKEYNSVDSTDSESWHAEEDWRDNFVFSGNSVGDGDGGWKLLEIITH